MDIRLHRAARIAGSARLNNRIRLDRNTGNHRSIGDVSKHTKHGGSLVAYRRGIRHSAYC